MRLKKDNIRFVTRLEYDGVTYAWHVGMKSSLAFDNRDYANYEDGSTVVDDYPIDLLPKSVREFVKSHAETQIESSDIDGHHFNRYRYI